MANEITNLIAAQLSQAAYGTYGLPSGWSTIGTFPVGDDSFSVYTNNSNQIVFAFKGTDSVSEIISDVANQGGVAWEKVKPPFETELKRIQANPIYANYQIFTDGHSLGGGMAQTAALENGLSGYGQNSLPISPDALEDAKITKAGGLSNAMAKWVEGKNKFYESTVVNDITTVYYEGDLNLYTNINARINTVVTSLPNAYAGAELAAAIIISTSGGAPLGLTVGVGELGDAEYEAHGIGNVVGLLKQAGSATGDTATINADASRAISATILTATQEDAITTTQSGSVVATEADGVQVAITLQSTTKGSDTYAVTLNGQPNKIVVVTTNSSNSVTVSTEIQSGATVEIPSNVNESGITETITFTGADETLKLDTPANFNATISNFAPGDTIDLAGVGTATAATLYTDNALTLQTGEGTVNLQLDTSQDYSNDAFLIAPDGDGGANVTVESDSQSLAFTGPNEVLLVLNSGSVGAHISGLLQGDTLDIKGPMVESGSPSGASDVVALVDFSGKSLGSLTVDPTAGTGSVTLFDGLVIPLTSLPQNISITNPASAGEDPAQVLVDYLSEIGNPLSLSQIDQLNFDYLNPAGTAYTVGPDDVAPTSDTTADVTYYLGTGPTAPGAVIAGQDTVTVFEDGEDVELDAHNILELLSSADLSRDSISDIQELDTDDSGVALTASQFASFKYITGNGLIEATSAGTFDLTGANVDPSAGYNLKSVDLVGTTLIGNDRNGETLQASQFGDDTLQAGNGTGDFLWAGEGVDDLIGGTGGDFFYADAGLTAGSSVTGKGDGNALQAGSQHRADISEATVTGIQGLVTGVITLTADQFNEFNTISGNYDGYNAIYAATAGTYDLSTKDTRDSFNMTALSDGGTTLIGNNAGYQTLTASQTGNDTLEVGSYSYGDTLIAGNGNDILRAASGDTLIAGHGIDTLIGGNGDDTFVATAGLAAGSSIIAEGSENVLETSGDLSNLTISGIGTLEVTAGDSITLTASELSGLTKLTGASGSDLFAATGGIFNLTASVAATGDAFNMTALSSAATKLEEDGAAYDAPYNGPSGVTLTASKVGSDTLKSNYSTGMTLEAANTTGKD